MDSPLALPLRIFLFVCVALKMIFVIWAMNKGFEITDEGAVMLGFNRQGEQYHEIHLMYQLLFSKFFIGDITLISIRWFTVSMQVLSALFFGWASHRYFQVKSLPNFGLTSWLGLSLLGFGLGLQPNAVYYLHICDSLTLIIGGLLIWSTSNNNSFLHQLIINISIGILLGVIFLAKFSTALVVLLLIPFFVLYHFGIRKTIVFTVLMLLGKFIFWTMFFNIITPYDDLLSVYQKSYEIVQIQGYKISDILLTYFAHDLPVFSLYLIPAFAFIAIRKWLLKTSAPFFTPKYIGLFFLLLLAVYSLKELMAIQSFTGWEFRTNNVLLALLVIGIYELWQNSNTKHVLKIIVPFILICLAIPLSAAAGTAIPLEMSLLSHLTAPLLAVLLIWGLTSNHMHKSIISGAVILLCSLHFLTLNWGYTREPSGQIGSAMQQTHHYNLTEDIYLNTATHKFFTETHRILITNGYEYGDQLIALTNMPGLVYLMKGRSPDTHWYFGVGATASPKNAIDLSCYHLGQMRISEVKQPIFLAINEKVDNGIINCLKQSKLGFPSNYEKVGSIYNPYMKQQMGIFKPKDVSR